MNPKFFRILPTNSWAQKKWGDIKFSRSFVPARFQALYFPYHMFFLLIVSSQSYRTNLQWVLDMYSDYCLKNELNYGFSENSIDL